MTALRTAVTSNPEPIAPAREEIAAAERRVAVELDRRYRAQLVAEGRLSSGGPLHTPAFVHAAPYLAMDDAGRRVAARDQGGDGDERRLGAQGFDAFRARPARGVRHRVER